MSEWNCNVIKDLLPLYIDEVCSEESRKIVDEHLEQCAECQKLLQQMEEEVKLPADETGDARNSLKKIKKILKKKYMIFAVSVAAVAIACTALYACLQLIETPIAYEDAKVSMVQDKEDPNRYNLTFNGQRYACLYGEFVTIKEEGNVCYQAEIIHTVSTPWTRIFEKEPFKNEVMGSYSADPEKVTGTATYEDGTRTYDKIVAVYYQATPADQRRLLWMADWFKDMEKEQPQADAEQEQ